MFDSELGLVGAPLFEPRTTVTGDAAGFWVGTARAYEVTRYDTSGRAIRIVRWSGPERKVTDDATRLAHQLRLASASPDQHEHVRRMHEVQPVSDVFPAYSQILTSRAGTLLIQEYSRPSEAPEARWFVFDSTGRLVGRFTAPPTLRVLEVGEDYLLGTTRDQDDLEEVRLFSIVR